MTYSQQLLSLTTSCCVEKNEATGDSLKRVLHVWISETHRKQRKEKIRKKSNADLCSTVSKEEIRTGCVIVLSDGHSLKMCKGNQK